MKKPMKTIMATDFEVLVDNGDNDVLGLQVNLSTGPSFVIPMARSTAKEVALLLLLVK
jgi:hypothetical protein